MPSMIREMLPGLLQLAIQSKMKEDAEMAQWGREQPYKDASRRYMEWQMRAGDRQAEKEQRALERSQADSTAYAKSIGYPQLAGLPKDVIDDAVKMTRQQEFAGTGLEFTAASEVSKVDEGLGGRVPAGRSTGGPDKARQLIYDWDANRNKAKELKNKLVWQFAPETKAVMGEKAFNVFAGRSEDSEDPYKNQNELIKLAMNIYGPEVWNQKGAVEKEDILMRLDKNRASNRRNPWVGTSAIERRAARRIAEEKKIPLEQVTQEDVDAQIQAYRETELGQKSKFAENLQRKLIPVREASNARNIKLREAERARYGMIYVYDTNEGGFTNVSRADMAKNPNRFVSGTPAEKIAKADSVFEEMNVSLDYLDEAITKLKPEDFDDTSRMLLARILGADSKEEVQSFITSEVGIASMDAVSPNMHNYIIALQNAYESILGLRTIQGIGQGSDSSREAMRKMLPSYMSPSKEYAKEQMGRVRAEVNALRKGVPQLILGPRGVAPGRKESGKGKGKTDGGAVKQLIKDLKKELSE